MATFAHDPSRVHPPYDPEADELAMRLERSVTDTARDVPAPMAPRTLTNYVTERVLAAVALGGSGEPHRLVYITTDKNYRNQGLARAMMDVVIADFDDDAKDSIIIVRNVDQDCDVPRLVAFFESLGYVQTVLIPEESCPQLARAHP
jgi:ribosomal protein S18 acetylase RimI-like enzyme